MVALLDCDEALADRVDRQTVYGERIRYTEAWRRSDWTGANPHLAVLVDVDGDVAWVGVARGGRPITTFQRSVEVSQILPLPAPVALGRIRGELPARHRSVAGRRGILPPAGGAELVLALKRVVPEMADDIDRLAAQQDRHLPTGARGEVLTLERDGVGVLLDMAGLARAPLRSWRDEGSEGSFLAGLPRSDALEDNLLAYDVERFGTWRRRGTTRVEWRVFEERGRRVLVMSANRTAVERTLGVDVVYYHEDQDCMVLVQYKKMSRGRRGDRPLAYRGDSHLNDELERMRRIDEVCAAATAGPFRLMGTPCWLKLVEPMPVLVDGTDLLRGMYLAREHFDQLLTLNRGPRGGVLVGYDNVTSYLTNTVFIGLVQTGLIGSRGVGTAEIRRLISESLASGRAVVFGLVPSS